MESIESLTDIELQALAYRLSVQQEELSDKLMLIKAELENRAQISKNPDTKTTVDADGIQHQEHGKQLKEDT